MNQRGMSLIEIMIVLVIVGSLMAIIGRNVFDQFNNANVKQARMQMAQLAKSLDMYSADCKQYPSTDEGLQALVQAPASCKTWGPSPYSKTADLKDPWNHDFVYENSGGRFTLKSYGKDGKDGGEGVNADIVFEP